MASAAIKNIGAGPIWHDTVVIPSRITERSKIRLPISTHYELERPTLDYYAKIRDGHVTGFTANVISPFPVPDVLGVYGHYPIIGGSEFLYLGREENNKILITGSMVVEIDPHIAETVRRTNGSPSYLSQVGINEFGTLTATFANTHTDSVGRDFVTSHTFIMKAGDGTVRNIARTTIQTHIADGEIVSATTAIFTYHGDLSIAKRE